MAKYGVPAIAMCIGPKGMAKTAVEKLDTARLLYETGKDMAYSHGSLSLMFSRLHWLLEKMNSSDSAKATLEGIRLVKQRLFQLLHHLRFKQC